MLDDRRRNMRYRLAMNVTMHVGGGGKIVRGRSLNVSRAGVFVLLSEHVPQGQRVELMLTPESAGEVIFVTGVVVHVVPEYGVGVRFSALSARADGKLMQLLERLQDAAA